MTCIVGLEHDGKVYMGADSASVGGWEVKKTRLSKVFKNNGFLIGYTTSFRMGQILQHHLNVRPQKPDETDEYYMVCVFAEDVRECLKEKGFSKIENNQEEGGTFLVGYKGVLYEVDNDFQVNSFTIKYNAAGCGAQYALGAMAALNDCEPEQRIERALEIASFFSGAVSYPFTMEKL